MIFPSAQPPQSQRLDGLHAVQNAEALGLGAGAAARGPGRDGQRGPAVVVPAISNGG